MKCVNHPDKEAIAECSQCGKPLCNQCAKAETKDKFICFLCAAVLAAENAAVGVDRRREEREEREAVREAKRRSGYLRIFIPVVTVAALVLVGLNVYFKGSIKSTNVFDPAEYPIATTIIIDQAIKEYAEDHGGRVPDDLQAIQEKYLHFEAIGAAQLDGFIYIRKSPTQYELRPKDDGKTHMSKFTMTEKGIE